MNSRIGLWELWVGVGIEGVESKVTVVPWVSSGMGLYPRVQIPYSIVQVTCAIALL